MSNARTSRRLASAAGSVNDSVGEGMEKSRCDGDCRSTQRDATAAARIAARPMVVSVIGYQDAGKTTTVEALVRAATSQGLAVAHLKHDGHADETDWPNWEKAGSDTHRVAKAGARWTMVASKRGWLLHDWRTEGGGIDTWLSTLQSTIDAAGAEVDLVVVEGSKRSTLPKIAVLRNAEDGDRLVADGVTGVIGVVCPADSAGGVTAAVSAFDAGVEAFRPGEEERLLKWLVEATNRLE